MSAKLAGKRKYASSGHAYIGMKRIYGPMKRRRTYQKDLGVVPGYTRSSGYYGRFAPKGGELKFHDVDADDAVIATGGVILNSGSINGIAQGVTESQRIGRKCTIKKIGWRYKILLPAEDAGATPTNGDSVRVILYLDKQCNGATAQVTDIMEGTNYHNFLNLANSNRFVILMDRMHEMSTKGLASDGAGVVSSSGWRTENTFYKNCEIPIEFSSTTGALGEIRSNNLGILLMGASGLASFDSKIRLRFSDN